MNSARESMRKLGRQLLEFVNPRLKAGRIPWGRTAIVVQIIGATIFLAYTLYKKDISLPFTASSYEVEVILPDAKGLDPKDGPSAAVAGSPLGKVTGVRYEDGHAVATLELDPEAKGKIFADARAELRPASALQNLLVNVDPGSPQAGPLPDGRAIEPQNTSAFVSIDELTSVFDADTQAYLQVVISEAQRALHGRSGELRHALAKLGELTETAKPVTAALAERRQLLTRLVGNLDTVVNTLSERGDSLGTVVDAGSRTLAVTASRSRELETAARDLAPVVAKAKLSLAATRGLTKPLAPALEQLAPAARSLPRASANLRKLVRPTGRFLDQTDALTREGQRPLSLFEYGTQGLTQRVTDLVPTGKDLSFRAGLLDKYKGGLTQFADTWGGVFSVADNGGIYGQVSVLQTEPVRPENFGFPSARAAGGREQLNADVASAFDRSCKVQSPIACLMRIEIPGLPPVSANEGAGN